MAVTGCADATCATRATSRSMPCAFSTSEMSTVTPHTITITRHGIRLIASPSSADRAEDEDDRAEKRAHADVDAEDDDADDERGDDARS